jgi:hypothetical protein
MPTLLATRPAPYRLPAAAAGSLDAMRRELIAGLTIRVGGTPVPAETLGAGVAGDIFILSTTLPDRGITIHSTYHGHEGLDTTVVRLALLPSGARQVIESYSRLGSR